MYEFYLACYRVILYRITAGKTAAEILSEAAVEMESILVEASFSKPHHRKIAEAFLASYSSKSPDAVYYLGHGVGMSTHDSGDYSGPLRPGMVCTIEPVLRVPEEKIYIRLEDLIAITGDGAQILSDVVPVEIEDVEATVREDGILQTHPRSIWSDQA